MTETLSHNEVEQLLPAAALEILEAQELAGVMLHARECADCAQLLESYREVVAGLATSLPERPLTPARSDLLRARLLARAANRRPEAEQIAGSRRLAQGARWQWTGWAVAAGFAGVLMVHHSVHHPVAYGWLVAGVLMLLLVALAVYIRIQQTRLIDLRRQLGRETGREGNGRDTSDTDT